MHYSIYLNHLDELDNLHERSNMSLYGSEDGTIWHTVNVESLKGKAIAVNVILSAHLVTVLSLHPPKNYRKYGKAFLLNFVEPDISQPIESVELFPLLQRKEQLSVAIIEKNTWKTLLTQIAERGWQLRKVCIDALCLPVSDNKASLFALGTQVLWHSPDDTIFSGDLALLEHTQDYQAYPSQWLSAQSTPINQDNQENSAISPLLTWAQSTQHNLHIESNNRPNHRKKALIATLAGLALILWTTNLYLSNRHHQRLAKNYYDESVKLFHQVLPQYKKIPSRSYLSQQLSRFLGGQSEAPAYWRDWLAQLAQHVNTEDIQLVNIDYRTKPARMTLTLDSENNEVVQALTNQLSQQLNVTVEQPQQGDESIRTTLEITQ